MDIVKILLSFLVNGMVGAGLFMIGALRDDFKGVNNKLDAIAGRLNITEKDVAVLQSIYNTPRSFSMNKNFNPSQEIPR